MVKVSPEYGYNSQTRLSFHCPGCDQDHGIVVAGPGAWGYNHNPEAPTFTPSVLIRSGHYTHDDQKPGNCWCDFEERLGEAQARRLRKHSQDSLGSDFKCYLCHSFVTDGRIQFLSDSTHDLAGQTVDLPEWLCKVPE